MRHNLAGRRFGLLVAQTRVPFAIDQFRNAMWLCVCDCGEQSRVRASDLVSGNSTSCGCRRHRFAKGHPFFPKRGRDRNDDHGNG